MMFHIYQDLSSEWRWYLTAPNGAKLATGAQGYTRRGDCVLAIKRIRETAEAPMIYDNFGPMHSVAGSGLMATVGVN